MTIAGLGTGRRPRPRHGTNTSLPSSGAGLRAGDAAACSVAVVLDRLGSTATGLSSEEAARRLAQVGANAVRTHHAQPLRILGRQFRSAVLILLAVTAFVSFFLGERTDTVVIGVILLASVGLGFLNEYRAARATDALHSQLRHTATVLRDGRPGKIDVTGLVPGDVVRLAMGEVVPADLRLLSSTGLQCQESVLTGESLPADKQAQPVPAGSALGDLACCAFMGTVVQAGTGSGVVVATGARAEFGRIAAGLGERQPETDFQVGLRQFSVLLLQVAVVLTALIFVINLLLHRPLLESLLFSLAIAVGITPQLLPAVVSTSLALGSKELAKRKVLVKRLVCIEDLGDLDVLVTDKTGTLTDGRIAFRAALDPAGARSDQVLQLGLLSTEIDPAESTAGAVGGNPLDAALWAAGSPDAVAGWVRLGLLPFDHDRQMTSTVVRAADGAELLVVKGAPEQVLRRCAAVPTEAAATLREQFAAGSRVLAVASRPAAGTAVPTPADERDLTLAGFLVFLDRPKASARASLQRLAALGIEVKVCTGDNPVVAERVCADLGLVSGGTLTGADLIGMDDDALAVAAQTTTIFARVSPEQKARLIALLRRRGRAVGFLGDGVNDALALHARRRRRQRRHRDRRRQGRRRRRPAGERPRRARRRRDRGPADLRQHHQVRPDGTSSNFGNMFSAAAASAVLPFLPMLPSQILLNNLLYDAGQLTIPTDRVDREQLRAPSHWDIGFIRRFMIFFGPSAACSTS